MYNVGRTGSQHIDGLTLLQMRYVAAYLLATLGGNNNPSAKDIKGILEAVGIEADQDRLDKVVSELSGKDINEVIMCKQE